MEFPAFIIGTFQASNQVPLLFTPGHLMYAQPLVTVFQLATTAGTATVFFTVYKKYLLSACTPLHILI